MTNSTGRNSLFSEFEDIFNQIASQKQNPSTLRSTLLNHQVKSEDNNALIEVEIPGVDPKDVKVRIEGRSLSVETPKGNAYVTIGQRLSADETTAKLKHGLLTILIPKRDAKVVEVVVHES